MFRLYVPALCSVIVTAVTLSGLAAQPRAKPGFQVIFARIDADFIVRNQKPPASITKRKSPPWDPSSAAIRASLLVS